MTAPQIGTPGTRNRAPVHPGVPTTAAHRHGSYTSDCTCGQPIAPGTWRALWSDSQERHPWCKP